MGLRDQFEKMLLKWEPVRIGQEIAAKSFDDDPVDRQWVQDIVDAVEESKLTYKFTGQFNGIMSSMLWRASCNGFNDIIEHLSSTYTDNVKGIAGHSFWCAAIDGNLEGMKTLMKYFRNDIPPKDISEALGRVAYQDNIDVVEYLLQDHGNQLNTGHIQYALVNAAAFGSVKTIDKLCTERRADITLSVIDEAIDHAKRQQEFLGEKYNFDAAIALLTQHKQHKQHKQSTGRKPGL